MADSGRQPQFLTASSASESPGTTARKWEPRQGMECGEYQLFQASLLSLPRASGMSLFDTCYDLAGRQSMQVPAVALRFEGGGELKLPAKNYLIPGDGAGTYGLAFAGTSGPVSIIGNVQQQGVCVSFDTAKNTVSFTADKY
uniref:Aspartic proteinase nepenthesin-1 n=1 Tax=Aegilops tauschii TaxID=37682 RepID=N1QTN5_AEGTA